jgi:hypothetical protein
MPSAAETCPCACQENVTRSEMCVRFLGEMKTNPSCLFVALYGENDLPYAVERGLADAIIERDTLYCPAIRFLYEIETAASDQQTERNIQIWFLLYFFFTILIGEITRTLVINVAIPPSMFLILEGILIGWYVEGDHPGVHGISVLDQVNAINPFMLFYIFLPGLAFEAAYNMNIHIFRRSFLQIMSLSLPGVTLGTALLGILIHEILPYDWSWQTSFLLGCILVATDTVGQQRWFMDSDQPSLKKLGTLIDAECQLDSDFAISRRLSQLQSWLVNQNLWSYSCRRSGGRCWRSSVEDSHGAFCFPSSPSLGCTDAHMTRLGRPHSRFRCRSYRAYVRSCSTRVV